MFKTKIYDLPKSGMELDGSSKEGGLRIRGGGGGGGGRMHWMTEWTGGASKGARNSLPGGAGNSSRRAIGIIISGS